MNCIVISGLTAAGKTTHGQLLAASLEVPFVSATDVLARIVSERTGQALHERWRPELDEARIGDRTIDDDLDAELIAYLQSSNGGVFDACLLPWMAPPDVQAIRIWLESDFASRVRKCVVSYLDESVSSEDCPSLVREKDAVTNDRLVTVCGCRFQFDPTRFEIVANNETLIPEATRLSADRGIAAFHPVLLEAVQYVAGSRTRPPESPWIRHITTPEKN